MQVTVNFSAEDVRRILTGVAAQQTGARFNTVAVSFDGTAVATWTPAHEDPAHARRRPWYLRWLPAPYRWQDSVVEHAALQQRLEAIRAA